MMPNIQPDPHLANRHAEAGAKSARSRLTLAMCLLFVLGGTGSGQVLARPGYKGASSNAAPWWPNAIFYDLSAGPLDPKSLAVRLDALRALHVDAIILPAPELPPPGSNGAMPNLDEFDNLLRQSSAHGIRVLLALHAPSSSADLSGLTRFWLNHGVAGFRIISVTGSSPSQTQPVADEVRKLAAGLAGQRIVLADLDGSARDATVKQRSTASHSSQGSAKTPLLEIDTRPTSLATFDAATLRPILAQAITQRNLLVDLRTPSSAPLSQAGAAMTLITQPAALIDSGTSLVLHPSIDQPKPDDEPQKPAPPPPPQAPPGTYLPYVPYTPPTRPHAASAPKQAPEPEDPLTTWYGQLAALHHDNQVLRSGSISFLDFNAQNALVWVSKPAPNAPRLTAPVFVICNLSATPLQLSLSDAAKKLDLHGFYLRTLLRTDHAMGAQDLNSVNVPAFGVYVGELHR